MVTFKSSGKIFILSTLRGSVWLKVDVKENAGQHQHYLKPRNNTIKNDSLRYRYSSEINFSTRNFLCDILTVCYCWLRHQSTYRREKETICSKSDIHKHFRIPKTIFVGNSSPHHTDVDGKCIETYNNKITATSI